MSNLSNEDLARIVEDDHVQCGDASAMARELLAYRKASMEAVAFSDKRNVGYLDKGRETALMWGAQNKEPGDIALYAAPLLPAAKINHQSTIIVSPDAASCAEIKQPSSMLTAVPELTNGQILDFMVVAFRHSRIVGDIDFDDIRLGLKLAIAAPPAQIVPEQLIAELLAIAKNAALEADECSHAEFSDDSASHTKSIVEWESRASMLKGDKS